MMQSDDALLVELGDRLAATRLERNLTQAGLAREAGVSRITVVRLEAGGAVNLRSFLRILRVLDLLDALDRLVPAPTPAPIDRLTRRHDQRRRASGSRTPAAAADDEPWRWGDEQTPAES